MRIYSILLLGFIWACSAAPVPETGELPDDLTALKALEKEKKQALSALEDELEQIDDKLRALDPNREVQKRLVTTRTVARKDFKRFAKIQGVVESEDLVSVSSELGGRITYMPLKEGQPVRRGQLVAKIDMESLNKQRSELEKSLELARDIYDRQARLWEQNIGSEVQYLQAKNNVERLEKSIETLDHQLTKSNLYAPISGVVDMVNLQSGETAGPGTPIIMILDTRDLKVVADVPEAYLGKVGRGDFVDVFVPALLDTMSRRVTLVGRKIDPTNRTFKIEIDIPSKSGLYKPNLLSEVLINDLTEPDVIVISQELVQQEVGGKSYVMVADSTQAGFVSRKVYVSTGESYEGDVVVTSGLAGAETLIVEGSRELAEGVPIEIVSREYLTTNAE